MMSLTRKSIKTFGIVILLVSQFYGANAFSRGVLYVIDTSGSMEGRIAGIKMSVRRMVQSPAYREISMGLVSYFGCGRTTAKYLVHAAINNSQRIIEYTNRLRSDGATDIANVLRMVRGIIQQMYKETGECLDMIVFTDNLDTCDNSDATIRGLVGNIRDICSEDEERVKIDIIVSTSVDKRNLKTFEMITTTEEIHQVATPMEQIQILEKILDKKKEKKTHRPKIVTKERPKEEEKGSTKKEPRKRVQPQPYENKQGDAQSKEKTGGGS